MIAPSQRAAELDAFIGVLLAHGVRSYLEVGARYGQTLEAVGDAMPESGVLVAVDLPNAMWGRADSWDHLEAVAERLRGKGHTVHLINGNSHETATVTAVKAIRPIFDAVFIDGDHRYTGVLTDWMHYGPLGHIVAFHDIAPKSENISVEVPRLWHDLRNRAKSQEILDPEHPGMGIGILWPTIATEAE